VHRRRGADIQPDRQPGSSLMNIFIVSSVL
jgi:hypothetical protein